MCLSWATLLSKTTILLWSPRSSVNRNLHVEDIVDVNTFVDVPSPFCVPNMSIHPRTWDPPQKNKTIYIYITNIISLYTKKGNTIQSNPAMVGHVSVLQSSLLKWHLPRSTRIRLPRWRPWQHSSTDTSRKSNENKLEHLRNPLCMSKLTRRPLDSFSLA